jgi:hypothetical protein
MLQLLAVGACCNVRTATPRCWFVWTAIMDSATAAKSVANRHDWPASAEHPSATKVAGSGVATMRVANNACDSANTSKSKSKN